MNGSHAIDTISIVNINVRHMYFFIFINNLNLLVLIFFGNTVTQLTDNGNELRHHLLNIRERPFL